MPQLQGNVYPSEIEVGIKGGHSFRRGAATWAGSVGLSDYDIKMLGYWSSDCFLRYIDSDRDQRLKAMTSYMRG
jgi:hypothetical protein